VKVRVQTQPGFARGLADGLPKIIKSEGALGLYKGLVPLWGRQVPYTMMKFAGVREYNRADVQACCEEARVIRSFTRGLPLRIFMIGTLSGGQWALYDAFKVLLGMPTTGGPAPAATELAKA
ncbi:hypothetical protein Prudu_589S000500, partial [Prunus dulcis]